MIYVVLARPSDAPLSVVGAVDAPNDDLACTYARATYDERPWAELWVVPRAALSRVTPPAARAATGEATDRA